MTKDIKETIEVLESIKIYFIKKGGDWKGDYPQLDAISHAIEILQTVESAGENLGKQITVNLDDKRIKSATYQNGYNRMHDIAIPILAKKILECEELRNVAKSASAISEKQLYALGEKDKRIEDLLILQEKFGEYHKEKLEELQSLKDKLTVENVRNVIVNHCGVEDKVFPLNWMAVGKRFIDGVPQELTKVYLNTEELAQALIKEFGGKMKFDAEWLHIIVVGILILLLPAISLALK